MFCVYLCYLNKHSNANAMFCNRIMGNKDTEIKINSMLQEVARRTEVGCTFEDSGFLMLLILYI